MDDPAQEQGGIDNPPGITGQKESAEAHVPSAPGRKLAGHSGFLDFQGKIS
jgi:hypothetical protein